MDPCVVSHVDDQDVGTRHNTRAALLLDAEALLSAFPDLMPVRGEVERLTVEAVGKRDQKGRLDRILKTLSARRYDSDTARQIAARVSTPPEIDEQLFSRCRRALSLVPGPDAITLS